MSDLKRRQVKMIQSIVQKRTNEVLAYCKPHLNNMWAAQVVGILLGCDFKDSRQYLAEYEELIGEEF